jgi:hypothetical protein
MIDTDNKYLMDALPMWRQRETREKVFAAPFKKDPLTWFVAHPGMPTIVGDETFHDDYKASNQEARDLRDLNNRKVEEL